MTHTPPSGSNHPQALIVIQARMSSARFPGKVLKLLGNKTLLDHLVDRAQTIKNSTCLVVFPEQEKQTFVLWYEGRDRDRRPDIFAGPTHDVLARFYGAIAAYPHQIIVRLTADCPFVDPGLVNQMIGWLDQAGLDYVNNAEFPSFPHGLDAEVFRRNHLVSAYQQARAKSDREHVTSLLRQHPHLKKGCLMLCDGIENTPCNSFANWRWTVDYEEDLAYLCQLWNLRYPSLKDNGEEPEQRMTWWHWIPTVVKDANYQWINAHPRPRPRVREKDVWQRAYAMNKVGMKKISSLFTMNDKI